MADENTVFIGNKQTMDYVQAVMMQFNNGENDVVIKARGRAISKAVDVAEITRNRFFEEADVDDIMTETEELQDEEGNTNNVSSIEITLSR